MEEKEEENHQNFIQFNNHRERERERERENIEHRT
jgi:hypothetical protein